MWRNSVYLAHWIYYGRGQERMAISALDERAGLVRLVHVLSPLPPATTALKRAPRQAARAHAESLSAVKGSTWEREKNWGRVEDRGQLVMCTILLLIPQSLESLARLVQHCTAIPSCKLASTTAAGCKNQGALLHPSEARMCLHRHRCGSCTARATASAAGWTSPPRQSCGTCWARPARAPPCRPPPPRSQAT